MSRVAGGLLDVEAPVTPGSGDWLALLDCAQPLRANRVVAKCALDRETVGPFMRAEVEKLINDIKQSVSLLRRHL